MLVAELLPTVFPLKETLDIPAILASVLFSKVKTPFHFKIAEQVEAPTIFLNPQD